MLEHQSSDPAVQDFIESYRFQNDEFTKLISIRNHEKQFFEGLKKRAESLGKKVKSLIDVSSMCGQSSIVLYGYRLPTIADNPNSLELAMDELERSFQTNWDSEFRDQMALAWAQEVWAGVCDSQRRTGYLPNTLDTQRYASLKMSSIAAISQTTTFPTINNSWAVIQDALTDKRKFKVDWLWLLYWSIERANEKFRIDSLNCISHEDVQTGTWLQCIKNELNAAPISLCKAAAIDVQVYPLAGMKGETDYGADVILIIKLPDAGYRMMLLQFKKLLPNETSYRLGESDKNQFPKLVKFGNDAVYAYQLLWEASNPRPAITAEFVTNYTSCPSYFDPFKNTKTFAALLIELLASSQVSIFATFDAALDKLTEMTSSGQLRTPGFVQIIQVGRDSREIVKNLEWMIEKRFPSRSKEHEMGR